MESSSSNLSRLSCRLCLKSTAEVGFLRVSHIIPRFLLLFSKEHGRSVRYAGDKKKPIISQFDWKEEMLCECCEGLMKEHEDYIHSILFSRKRKFLLWEDRDVAVYSADNEKIAFAFITIFWRAAVSSLREFRNIVLPDDAKDQFRKSILGKTMPSDWAKYVNVRLIRLLDFDEGGFNVLITPFVRPRGDGDSFEFTFSFGGYYCIFEIPATLISERNRFRIKPRSNILRIRKIVFTKIPELNRKVIEMLVADRGIPISDAEIAPV